MKLFVGHGCLFQITAAEAKKLSAGKSPVIEYLDNLDAYHFPAGIKPEEGIAVIRKELKLKKDARTRTLKAA